MLKRPKSSLFRQPILGHPERNYDAIAAPVVGNRAAKLYRHATVKELAAVSAVINGGGDRWSAALGPDHHHFAVMSRA